MLKHNMVKFMTTQVFGNMYCFIAARHAILSAVVFCQKTEEEQPVAGLILISNAVLLLILY